VASTAAAHELRPSVIDLNVAGDVLDVEIRVNLEALIARIPPEHTSTETAPQVKTYAQLRALDAVELRKRFEDFSEELLSGIDIVFDGQRAQPSINRIDLIDAGDTRIARDSVVVLVVPIPEGSQALVWSWADAFGPAIVRKGVASDPNSYTTLLSGGASSDALSLFEGASMGEGHSGQSARGGFLSTLVDYIRYGFVHIVPLGLDHILFVVGLFLLSPRVKPLVLQVSSFTFAHSLTLGLGVLGVLSVSPALVEPLIALSIVLVGVENMVSRSVSWRRMIMVFAFGLLHGLGFAGVLGDVGLAPGTFATSLLGFNIGVELGQLFVLLVCYLIVFKWRKRSWYRNRIVRPGSLVIAGIGAFWFLERVGLIG
jgi:hydrogenase/urease accessory protein HupE